LHKPLVGIPYPVDKLPLLTLLAEFAISNLNYAIVIPLKNEQTSIIVNGVCCLPCISQSPIKGHNHRHSTVDSLGALSLSGLILPAGSVLTKILSIIQRRTGCPPWAIFSSKVSFISSLVGGDISLYPAERDYCKAHALKILHHLHSTPPVKGDFLYVKPSPQIFYKLFDEP